MPDRLQSSFFTFSIMDLFGLPPLNQQNPDIVPTISLQNWDNAQTVWCSCFRVCSRLLWSLRDIMLPYTQNNMQGLNGKLYHHICGYIKQLPAKYDIIFLVVNFNKQMKHLGIKLSNINRKKQRDSWRVQRVHEWGTHSVGLAKLDLK